MNEVDKQILRRNLIPFLVNEIFNTVTEEDILRINGKVWTYKGNDLSEAQMKVYQAEAQKFLKSKLWELLRNELRWQSQKRLLEKAQSEYDIIACKLLSYLTDVIESKLKKMSSEE